MEYEANLARKNWTTVAIKKDSKKDFNSIKKELEEWFGFSFSEADVLQYLIKVYQRNKVNPFAPARQKKSGKVKESSPHSDGS